LGIVTLLLLADGQEARKVGQVTCWAEHV
jgi:hypothetical protein